MLRTAAGRLLPALLLLVCFLAARPGPEAASRMAWRQLAFTVARTAPPEGVGALILDPALPEVFRETLRRLIPLRPGRQPLAVHPLPARPEAVAVAVVGAGGRRSCTQPVRTWHALVPALTALVLALLTRRALAPLVAGVLVGALLLEGGEVLPALTRTAVRYVYGPATTQFYLSLILFLLCLVGLVGIGIRSGGVGALVDLVLGRLRSPRTFRRAAPVLGILLFFDDYANTVVLGNALRPLADRLRMPREKLAYIVDSTAAPVAGLMFVSTWIWFEVGQIQGSLSTLGAIRDPGEAYAVFLAALPYRFYCVFTLALLLWNGWLARDFGPMWAAEMRARTTGHLVRPGGRPLLGPGPGRLAPRPGVRPTPWTFGLPLLVTFLALPSGLLLFRGEGQVLGGPEATGRVLAGAAFLGALTAAAQALRQRLLRPWETVRAFFAGARAAGFAVAVLFAAWALGRVCEDLGTATYLAAGLERHLPVVLLPTALFLIGALVSFATGSSFSTMGILLPVGVPLVYTLAANAGLPPLGPTVVAVAAVLDGAIFGDHASPLSDTTILASAASGSDHLDHVRTQLPYALTAAGAAVVLGHLPAAAGLSPLVTLPLGILAVGLALRLGGRPLLS